MICMKIIENLVLKFVLILIISNLKVKQCLSHHPALFKIEILINFSTITNSNLPKSNRIGIYKLRTLIDLDLICNKAPKTKKFTINSLSNNAYFAKKFKYLGSIINYIFNNKK